ncbi:unnamed protein product [Acanthoscelides obtectus]|uniref:Regulatory protein zeste n=1 Tax=Acanthoscelides obtectus TaxID=200917 RepID=A0A9P0LVH8_ACAOB|nr:unnamed protein product [Acanthoscelides obtectus]CAK1683798.1 Myb/SANT-like DNA-binding domain-containing protein 3 [Acanthoscelides obtectus]
MTAKPTKRLMFSEAHCHSLVDIVLRYKNIVECKRTDAVTWKQKAAAWEKIAELYNSATTESRTADQLRCKFDNLKKEVRKYEAHRRQNLLRTGGGADERNLKKAVIMLYEKIKSIIGLSVHGLQPSVGDSDDASFENKEEAASVCMDESNKNTENVHEEDVDLASMSIVLNEDSESNTEALEQTCELQTPSVPVPQQSPLAVEVIHDWSDYTPRHLQSRKHRVLQGKRKRSEEQSSKEGLTSLKRKLLDEEAARNEEHHEQKMKNEQELHELKAKNLQLQNKKLEYEILLLQKQIDA